MNKFFSLNIDFIGFVASFLCAIHCTAIPIIFSLGLIDMTDMTHNHTFDFIIVGFGIVIASFSIVRDYIKHKVKLPFIVATFGILSLATGLLGHHASHETLSVIGGILLASSHFINWRINHKDC
jgi:hypothetical protein